MMWAPSVLLAVVALLIGFIFIYTGIWGLSGRPVYIPRRGGATGGDTISGVGARVVGAFCLLFGVFWVFLCALLARAVFG